MAFETKNSSLKVEYGKKYCELVLTIAKEFKTTMESVHDIAAGARMKSVNQINNVCADATNAILGAFGQGSKNLYELYTELKKVAPTISDSVDSGVKQVLNELEPLTTLSGSYERFEQDPEGNEDWNDTKAADLTANIQKLTKLRFQFISEFATIGKIDTDDSFITAHKSLGGKFEAACNELASSFKIIVDTNESLSSAVTKALNEGIEAASQNINSGADAVSQGAKQAKSLID